MRRPETVAAPSGARRMFPRADSVRVPYDPRRREALAAFSEAHRPSPYVRLPVRRLLGGLARPEGTIELRVRGRPAFVAVVVDRCENLYDAALLEVLGWDRRAPLAPFLAAALPVARAVALAAGRSCVSLSLPVPLAGAFDAAGWLPGEGSYVLERTTDPWPSPPLPAGAAWEDLSQAGVTAHYHVLRAAFADDPGMMTPDLATFTAATLAADPPVRVLRVNGVEVGFARVALEPDGVGTVATVGRAPDWRGARLGDIVLAEAMRLLVARGAARLRLGVTATNAPALALYRRAGFSVVEAWRGWRLALGEDR